MKRTGKCDVNVLVQDFLAGEEKILLEFSQLNSIVLDVSEYVGRKIIKERYFTDRSDCFMSQLKSLESQLENVHLALEKFQGKDEIRANNETVVGIQVSNRSRGESQIKDEQILTRLFSILWNINIKSSLFKTRLKYEIEARN